MQGIQTNIFASNSKNIGVFLCCALCSVLMFVTDLNFFWPLAGITGQSGELVNSKKQHLIGNPGFS